MIGAGKNNWRSTLLLLVKLAVVAAALYYLWHKISTTNDLGSIAGYFRELSTQRATYFLGIAVVLLSPINWGLETIKWQYLMQKMEQLSFPRAFKAVLSGLTLSTFTPNRIGDYAGRVAYLREASRGQATVITFLGNMAQLTVTLVVGIVASVLGIRAFGFPAFLAAPPLYWAIAVAGAMSSAGILWLFLRAPRSSGWLNRVPFLRKWERYHRSLTWYSGTDLVKVLSIAFVRFIVFSLQYALLLRLFEVELTIAEMAMLIPATFLILTAVPTIALTELGVREAAAIQLFALASGNTLGIVAATFALWMVNLAIPAIIGSLFVLSFRPFNRTANEPTV